MDSPSGFPKLTWAQPGGHMPHYPFSINELYVKADAHVSLLRRIILRALMATGAWVEAGERLAFAGEALINIAAYAEAGQISDHIEAHQEELAPNGGEPDDTEPPLI